VTGVQTCALPIYNAGRWDPDAPWWAQTRRFMEELEARKEP